MTVRVLLLATSALLVLALGGCQRDSDPALVSELDSLIVHLDSLEAAFAAIEPAEHQHMDSVFQGQVVALQQAFMDTLQQDTALLLGNYYRAMTKSQRRLLGEYGRVRTALDSSLKKVRDLRRDVDRGLIPLPDRRLYADQEKKIGEELDRQVTVLLNSHATVLRHWPDRETVEAILTARSDTLH